MDFFAITGFIYIKALSSKPKTGTYQLIDFDWMNALL